MIYNDVNMYCVNSFSGGVFIIKTNSKNLFPISFRFKDNILSLTVTAILLFIFSLIISSALYANLYKIEESDMFAKSNIISDYISLHTYENESTKDFIGTSLAGTKIRGIILDGSGQVLLDTNTDAKADGVIFANPIISHAISGEEKSAKEKNESGTDILSVASPVRNESGNVFAAVYLSKDMSELNRALVYIRLLMIIFSAVIVVLFFGFSANIGKTISSPINEFVAAAQKISKGDFSGKISIKGNAEMIQLANAMNYMCSELELLESKRRKFVSDASHELKTPMATIKLLCDSITSSSEPDIAMVQEFLSDLSDEVDRLTRIIEKLLLLTKLDSKEIELSFELVDFGMMISRIKNKISPMALNKNITITADIPSELPPVMIDHDKIWEAVYNVMDNAVKYSKIGTAVKISIISVKDKIILRISDSGKGIPDEFKERIFERFYRLDDSRARDTGGTGLGLAIAREAVILHGGKLYVEDNPEGGSCFVMELPQNAEAASKQVGGEG